MDCTRPGNCVAAAWISAVTSAKLLTKAGQTQVLHNERRHAMSSLKESIHEVRRSEQETAGTLRELAGQVRRARSLSSAWSTCKPLTVYTYRAGPRHQPQAQDGRVQPAHTQPLAAPEAAAHYAQARATPDAPRDARDERIKPAGDLVRKRDLARAA